MSSDHANPDADSSDRSNHRRRPRYKGTHPVRFDERYKELDPDKYPEIQEHVRDRGQTPAGTHVPIMLEEVMACLRPQPGHTVVDATIGYGGHAEEFLQRIGPTGSLIGLDVDAAQLERTRERLTASFPQARITLLHSNFAGVDKCLKLLPDSDGLDIIFADLGVSSMQIDDPDRGFSYKRDGPLDMRMDARIKRTAADLLETLTQEQLSAALCDLADEPDHQRIAAAIVQQRKLQPISHTKQLVDLIFKTKQIDIRTWKQQRRTSSSLPSRRLAAVRRGLGRSESGSTPTGKPPTTERLHPAALTFQALRILVNDELGALAQLLRIAPYCLRAGGRIGIITFHSGEDRLVKHAFRDGQRSGIYSEISNEVIRATPAERRANPRSSAAKFRWAKSRGF